MSIATRLVRMFGFKVSFNRILPNPFRTVSGSGWEMTKPWNSFKT